MRILLFLALCLPAYGQERLYQFAVDQDHLAGAPDFSYLNHPLTAADRVVVKDGHFFTADGHRLRLFGVNTAFGANFPEEQDAARIARRLRRLGINLVRLHHMDSSPDRNPNDARSTLTTGPYPTLNPVSIARLRAFLDALKAEGIYVNLNLHVGYEFRPDIDRVPAIPGAGRLPTQSKPLHIFYPRMVDLQVDYATRLISALKLKGDPVLAMVEIDNETSLIDAWQKNQIDRLITGEYRIELDRQKKEFLQGRPDSVDETIRFFVDRDRAYLNRMHAAVRQAADAQVPVTGTQVGFGGLMNYDSHQDLDYQDNHFYIDHYNFPNRPWDGRDWRQRNSTSTATGFATYLNMAATRQAGRPFTLSEFNQPFPNTYAAEIDPTLAAFAAFQDWDALMHFAWEHGREWDRGGPSGFNLNGDWTKWPNVGQSAWIFRTGAVLAAREEIRIPLPLDARMESARQKTNGNAVRFLKSSAGYDANTAFVHRVALATTLSGPLPEAARSAAAPYRSDTGELVFDPARRVFRIEAPQAAGIFGFAGDAPVSAGAVTLQLAPGSRGYVAALLTALDNRPLPQSARMLLSLPGSTVPRGQSLIHYPGTTDWWTLSPDAGQSDKPSGAYSASGPIMMERVECTLTLRTGARSLSVYPLDGAGHRMAALDETRVTRDGSAFRLHLAAGTPWYEIVAPVRIELVTGGHSHELSFYDVFRGNPDFRVNVNPHPLAFTGDMRKSTDVLVLYDMADVNEEPRRKNLRDFLEAGKGMVVLHHAIIDNQHWPWWYQDVVGGRYLLSPDGPLKASTYQHDVALKIHATVPHPITAQTGDFNITDEVYNFMWRSPKSKVLLEADRPEGEKAVAWIGPWEKSRVVVIQLGHGQEAHENPAYRQLVRNAILWAAGRM